MSRLTCVVSFSVAVLLAGSALAQHSETKPLIVCSTTQVADFARQVVGDRWVVVSILAPGQDPHVYEIKGSDTRLVARAALCLENGWHLEGKDWMKTLCTNADKPLITCVDGAEPIVLEEDGQTIHDPHAWFSPQNAAVYVRNILHGVAAADPEHAEEYQSRADLYLSQLRTLHLWIQREVNAIPADKRILVTSHDAFNYFCRDYGFKSAAPEGWSTGQEVGGGQTPERRRLAVESIRKFGVKAIFVETSVNPKLIQQIAADAGVKIGGELYSDSMGRPVDDPRDAGERGDQKQWATLPGAGETYLGMMRENVLTIVEALR